MAYSGVVVSVDGVVGSSSRLDDASDVIACGPTNASLTSAFSAS